MRKIILLTESGADMPLDLVKLHNIKVVPMHVIMGDKSYADGSIAVSQVYDYYQRTKKVPSTSATNPDEYQHVFKRITEENSGCIIIHVGYSSKPSCSYQNSIIASEGMENIYHADALNVTGGLAAIVLKAAELIEKHPDMLPNDLVKNIESYAAKARVSFIPGDLVYLKAGGRVSNAAYLGGTLLQLKPLIEIVNGELVSTQKYRGKIGNIVEKYMKEYIGKYHMDKEQIYLIYSLGIEEHIKQHMEQIAKVEGFKKIIWIQAGCMISAHSGPGAIGIAAFENMSSK
ncbi:DegV family protein [Clostridium estertheticum]|uniref:DegV family protein n=1 Tax=Clostridium estertheticum TaxID=238834 RepID=UPI0013E93BD1|nr:DegV family protein [Clostridium estertheticum]MBZ9686882.1 DegV family protein [Clostridium estertheticum]